MSIYEEVEIEDLDYDPVDRIYTYPCPCGDKFRITLEELWDGEDIAPCPSCTLQIEIIYDEDDLPPLPEDETDDENTSSDGETECEEDNLAKSVEEKLTVA
jgi:diphthamide biosynthesis protein 3